MSAKKRNAPKLAYSKGRSVLRDPRFVIGLIIVVISLVGTTLLVRHARSGEALYLLRENVAMGQTIDEGKLEVVDARPETHVYVKRGALPKGAVATRSLSAGELLPQSAVSDSTAQGRRQVVVNVSGDVPSSVKVGSAVEVWQVEDTAVDPASHQEAAKPLSGDAIVLGVHEPGKGLSIRAGRAVEVSVPETDLPGVLAGMSQDKNLVVVPRN
ncbi:hypothetical protein [Gleimia hominis]|uniref:hypothetical protein n=1 Tax=Gleimia hominis TaxID=595468 RepID=UPI001304188F|nr:hypothetical protein [Gleimia hominis]WIK64780.1 hypothetical protein CJ187_001570 [Gleimia hominis]